MAEFVFVDYRIQVDVERTRSYYDAHRELFDRCSCAYCRNFRAALPHLPQAAGEFLAPLGLPLELPAEVMEWCRESDGRHWYTLQYHLAGALLKKGETPVQVAPEITAGFTEGSGPFLKSFPKLFFQLFLDLRLPWLLDEADH